MGTYSAAAGALADGQPQLQAVAYVNARTGQILEAAVREGGSGHTLEVAAEICPALSYVPSLGADDDVPAAETLVVSTTYVSVCVRSRRTPGQLVIGVAAPGVNVALLVSSLRAWADRGRTERA